MKYHGIAAGLIGVIATFGVLVPLVTTLHCDSIQVFDDDCLRFGGAPADLIRLAGAEIYYDYLIYHTNRHLIEDPNVDQVFVMSGPAPKEFPNVIVLKHDETFTRLQAEPGLVMINLAHDPTVTVLNESDLGYDIISRQFGNIQLSGTVTPDGAWTGNFTNVGVYTYLLEPASGHGFGTSFRVLAIDEPFEGIPKSVRHHIACQLAETDHERHPYFGGMSCGDSRSDSISVRFDKSLRGASYEFKQEFLGETFRDAGFLEPEITFDYENRLYTALHLPLMTVGPPSASEYYTNSKVLLFAICVVIPSVLAGVFLYRLRGTTTDRRFVIAGLAGIAASSVMFFGSAAFLISDGCCGLGTDDAGKILFSYLRFLSTPFALVSTCFFYRGLSEGFNRRYIVETAVLMILAWIMLFFM